MKELRSLAQVKEMLEERKATNNVKEGFEIQPSRSSAHASCVNTTIADIITAGGEYEYGPGLFESFSCVEMFMQLAYENVGTTNTAEATSHSTCYVCS